MHVRRRQAACPDGSFVRECRCVSCNHALQGWAVDPKPDPPDRSGGLRLVRSMSRIPGYIRAIGLLRPTWAASIDLFAIFGFIRPMTEESM